MIHWTWLNNFFWGTGLAFWAAILLLFCLAIIVVAIDETERMRRERRRRIEQRLNQMPSSSEAIGQTNEEEPS